MRGLLRLVLRVIATALLLALFTTYDGDGASHTRLFGYPVVSAKANGGEGLLALGQTAHGVLVLGQGGIGLVTFAQAGVGLLFGIGQLMTGMVAIAQVGVAISFFFGQCGAGATALGQAALGRGGEPYLSEMNEEFGELLRPLRRKPRVTAA